MMNVNGSQTYNPILDAKKPEKSQNPAPATQEVKKVDENKTFDKIDVIKLPKSDVKPVENLSFVEEPANNNNQAEKTNKSYRPSEFVKGLYLRDKNFDNKVSFTFDDGPNENTGRVLDILKEHDVKAVFFVNGAKIVDGNGNVRPLAQKMLKRMVDEGHTIGNHTQNHENLSGGKFVDGKHDCADVESEIQKTTDAVNKALGYEYKSEFMRPPFGERGVAHKTSCSDGLTKIGNVDKVLEEKDMKMVLWQIDSEDWKMNSKNSTTCAEDVENNVFTEMKQTKGGVILFHDIHAKSAGVLEKVLDKLQNQDKFEIVKTEDLMEQKYEEK